MLVRGMIGVAALVAVAGIGHAQTKGAATVDMDPATAERIKSPDFMMAQRSGDVALMRKMLAGTPTTVVTPQAIPPCVAPNSWQWGYHLVPSAPGSGGGRFHLVYEMYCGMPMSPIKPKIDVPGTLQPQ